MRKTEYRLVCDWCKHVSPAEDMPFSSEHRPTGWVIDDTNKEEHHFCCSYHYAKWLAEKEFDGIK